MLPYEALKDEILRGVRHPDWSEGPDREALEKALHEIEERFCAESRAVIKARMTAYILENAPVAVEKHAVFADRIRHESTLLRVREEWTAREKEENAALRDALAETERGTRLRAWSGGLDCSHTCPDWERILRLGIPGIPAELKAVQAPDGSAGFTQAGVIVWEGMRSFALRLAAHADGAPCAAFLSGLAAHAPESVPEALQLMLLVYIVQTEIEGTYVRSFGRLDQLLLPFFARDTAEGKYTLEEEKEFLRHFYARISAINHPNNIPICLAGQDRDGNCAVNGLTELLREVYDGMGLYSPKFQIRVTDGVPDEYLKKVLGSIRGGRSSYVFMNDDSVIPALEKLGVAPADARDYVPVGCYEPDAYGEVPCTCAGTVSMLKCVETALFDGRDPRTGEQIGPRTGEAADFEDFQAFLDAVHRQTAHAVAMSMKRVDAWEKCYARLNPSPLFSSGLACCAERRKDAYQGGALYADSSINLIGMTDAADALCAVRWAVFEQRLVGMAELASVLRNNWQGAETLRRRIRGEAPRYGNGSPEADRTARELCAFAADLTNGKPNARGGVYRAGLFSIDWVYAWGEGCGATPEGRFAGEPLSKNLNATLGSDRHGPGALAHSAALLAGCGIPNGAVLDLLLHPTLTEGEAGLAAMLALLRVYMKEGGQCLQMNVFDADTLEDAQAHPERYESLQVRVCGWNALFTRLSRKEQDMFIRQARAQ